MEDSDNTPAIIFVVCVISWFFGLGIGGSIASENCEKEQLKEFKCDTSSNGDIHCYKIK